VFTMVVVVLLVMAPSPPMLPVIGREAAAAGVGVEAASPAPAGREQACRRQAETATEAGTERERQLCLGLAGR
jgi:hypothetical protein